MMTELVIVTVSGLAIAGAAFLDLWISRTMVRRNAVAVAARLADRRRRPGSARGHDVAD